MDRKTVIEARLLAYCRDELHIYASVIATDDWQTLPLVPQYRFGWMPPMDLEPIDVEDNLIAVLAPGLIDQVTAHLSDDELDLYLTFIEATIAQFVHQRGVEPAVVEQELEAVLWDQARAAITLRNDVELRALDAGIVPVITN